MHTQKPPNYFPGMGFPYSSYPTPYLPPGHGWYGPYTNPGPQPVPSAPQHVTAPVKYPSIISWLRYCDNHADCAGGDFSSVAWKFDKEGYHHIEQLTGSRVSIDSLSQWLEISKGTADLLICYAEQDVECVKVGMFLWELVHNGELL
jgi:hypothetical protein